MIKILIVLLFISARVCAQDLEQFAQELAEAEKKFASDAVNRTIKKAFLSVLADEAVVFRPHPVNGRWAYLIDSRPDSTYLFWQPELVHLSAGGDFGYSTGPWYSKRSKRFGPVKGFGNFVTIWKKDDRGNWKVLLDKGVNYTQAGERKISLEKRVSALSAKPEKNGIEDLLQLDSQSFGGNEFSVLDESALMLRHGRWPSRMDDFYRTELKSYSSWEPINGSVAPFGDMAYSYGTYQSKHDGQNQQGYYLRIWQFGRTGVWKIILDLRTEN